MKIATNRIARLTFFAAHQYYIITLPLGVLRQMLCVYDHPQISHTLPGDLAP